MERKKRSVINNAFYDGLKERWYTASDHPIALLRAENKLRAPWIIEEIERQAGKGAKILDVGCGAGFLSNELGGKNFDVTGIDISKDSLHIAQSYDTSKKVKYLHGNAYSLPFRDGSFDAVVAMDILEHVEDPAKLIEEASRVLRQGGLFFFHTFNQNFLSYLIIIKGVEWCIKNAPMNMHVYDLFIPPKTLVNLCEEADLSVQKMKGLRPKMTKSFWKMIFSGTVPTDFTFTFCKNLTTGYVGIAIKTEEQ